jgi:hypothetical protein
MTSFNHTRFMAGIVMRTQPWLAASAEPAPSRCRANGLGPRSGPAPAALIVLAGGGRRPRDLLVPGPVAATRWNPATDATIEVRSAATTPTWQQLGLQVTGPDGRLVPVSTDRSTARYDLSPGQLGRAVARFEAGTAGRYQVAATRAAEAGAILAVGEDFARDIAMTTLGASLLGLVTVLAAVLAAVITYRAGSQTSR